ncbi:putative short-chain dehydrogenase/reductase family protein [Xylariales sp. PMI_506]|nr:putative short-chain dehydrogenase/reductase family protein [Xylariales sp. PMI_506]
MISPTFLASFLRSHTVVRLPKGTESFVGQTIIVTGSNTGLGLEAARHFVHSGAARVILGVRSLAKGNAAKTSIEASAGKAGVVEVWELDLASYASVKAFAARIYAELDRLDVVVENAGMLTQKFAMAEDNEATITVNVVNTFLLALLLLPKLRETSTKLDKSVVLTFTGSFVHYITSFPERKAKFILQETATNKGLIRMWDRYHVSKMLELLAFREFAAALAQSQKLGRIITSIVNPGLVNTDINREAGAGITGIPRRIFLWLLGRSSEEGARTLVHAAEGHPETNGQYLNDCKIGEVSSWVRSSEGQTTQKRFWNELIEQLEHVEPGISENL